MTISGGNDKIELLQCKNYIWRIIIWEIRIQKKRLKRKARIRIQAQLQIQQRKNNRVKFPLKKLGGILRSDHYVKLGLTKQLTVSVKKGGGILSFIDLAKKRYSVRCFEDILVEKEKILKVLEAGRVAPSAVNYQPRQFVVITEEAMRQKIYSVYPRRWFQDAPVIIAVCGDHKTSWKRNDGKDHCDIDVAIAIDHMTLQATDLGLGTCWICAFDAKRCHDILGLPDYMEVIALLPLGYPAGERVQEIKRKELNEMVRWI